MPGKGRESLRSAPTKGRPPACPPNVGRRWSPSLGWRFRAVLKAQGHKHVGNWRATREEAQADARDLRERVEHAASTPELLTVDDAIDLFLARAEERGFRRRKRNPCRPATVAFYREITETIRREIGPDVLLCRMDAPTLQDYLKHRASQERKRCRCEAKNLAPCAHRGYRPSPSRLNKERGVWSRIFQTAIDAGLHPGPNPVDRVDEYTEERREAAHYSLDEVTEIVRVIRSRDGQCTTATWFADVVSLLFMTGLRIGELAHLKVRDVDLVAGELQVPREGKTGSRTLPLRAPQVAVLRRLLAGRAREDSVLPGKTPDQRSGNLKSNVFRRWRAKLPANLRSAFHAHTFRHSFETHLLDAGAPPHHVQPLMGHADRTMTDRYAHADRQRLRQAMANAFDTMDEELWAVGRADQPSASLG